MKRPIRPKYLVLPPDQLIYRDQKLHEYNHGRAKGIQTQGCLLVFLLIQEKIGSSIPGLLLRLIHNLVFGIQALENFSISLDSLSKPVISFEDTVIASTPTIFLFT